MAALLLSSLALASTARAETRASFAIGTIGGTAHDVRADGGTSDLSPTQGQFGLVLRGGVAASRFEAGVLFTGATSFGPSTLAAGLYAGPALTLGRRVRVVVTGELGEQAHGGFGSEFFLADAQSSDVTLPFAGASASVWLKPSASEASTLSVGLYAEARFDLGHGTGQAVVTPSSICLGLLECLIEAQSPPQPFTQSYDVGGHVVYFGFLARWDVVPSLPTSLPRKGR
jgi:hypothetical protein